MRQVVVGADKWSYKVQMGARGGDRMVPHTVA